MHFNFVFCLSLLLYLRIKEFQATHITHLMVYTASRAEATAAIAATFAPAGWP